MIGTSAVTTDPESLRFQYSLDEPALPKKKTTPTVYREQDRFLPINNVSSNEECNPSQWKGGCVTVLLLFIVVLQVSKDAKECMQECVSEFVSFITSE